MVSGIRFVHGNVIIRVARLFTVLDAEDDPIDATPPRIINNEQLLDPSGTYVLEVSIRAEDDTSSNHISEALRELTDFGKSVDGAIDLLVVDRLALDTRVKV